MAKFTVTVPLNTQWKGHSFIGSAGTTYRIPDSLYAQFLAEFVTGKDGRDMPGLAWVEDDEIGAGGGVGGDHPDLAAHISLGLITATGISQHVASADPHTQYALDSDLIHEHDADYAALVHGHAIGDTTNLQSSLDGKAASIHSHAQSQVTNLTTDLSGKAATIHAHEQSSVTNLTTDLAGKAATVHTHAQSSVTNLVSDLAGKAATVHTHAHSAATGIGADDHHAQSHAHNGSDGSGTIAYSAITGKPSTFAPAAHAIAGSDHTASGLTAGHVMRATGAAAFSFGAIQDGDLPATIARDSELHAENHASRHAEAGADELDLTTLAGFPGGTSDFLRADGSFAAPTATAASVSKDDGAAGDYVARVKLNADTAYRAHLGVDSSSRGSLELGAGGSAARDVRIVRGAAGQTKFDSNGSAITTSIMVEASSSQLVGVNIQVAGDANSRMALRGDATLTGISMGAGSAARDVSLARTAAKQLTIDDGSSGTASLVVNGPLTAGRVSSFCIKSSTQSVSATSFADSTGLSFSVAANRSYRFRFVVFAASNATTVGVKLGLNGPAGATLRFGVINPAAAPAGGGNAAIHAQGTAYNTEAIAATAGPGATGAMAIVEGTLVTGANAGTLQLRHASETATATSIMAGSYGELTSID